MSAIECAIGKRRFALDAEKIAAVLPCPPVTPLPLAPPCIAGIVEVRRELVTVIDPFGIPPESGKLLLLLEKDVGVRIDSVKQVPASAELLLDVDKILQAIVREVAQCSC